MLSNVTVTESTVTVETTKPGILFVVSSPSGGGKGTIIQRALAQTANVSYSVSYTTRSPRPGEADGREYFFIDTPTFQQMIDKQAFLEWAIVHEKLYGTAKDQVARELNAGRDIILEVDVQGAASVRQLIHDSVSVFILPPSFSVLKERLTARATDSVDELKLRLGNAAVELRDYLAFDYVIVNDDAERAAHKLAAIIEAERSRLSRQKSYVQQLVEGFFGC